MVNVNQIYSHRISKWEVIGIIILKFISNILYLTLGIGLLLLTTVLFGYGAINLTLGEKELFYRYLIYGVISLGIMFLTIFGLERIKFKNLMYHIAYKEGALKVIEDERGSNVVLKTVMVLLSTIIIIIGLVSLLVYVVAGIINDGDVYGLIDSLFN